MVSRVENPNVYTDLSGLQAISRTGRDNTPEGLRQVARQFESLFINMMLKAMRNSNSSLFEDNFLRSNEMEFHQENLDNQLSLNMSDAGGIGLADALYRQMLGRFNVSETEKSVTVAQRQIAPRRPVVPVAESLPVSDTASMTYDAIHSPEDFVIRLLPFAEAAASRIGVDPRLLLAQSALETGWGSAVPAGSDGNSSHNLFGVKAD